MKLEQIAQHITDNPVDDTIQDPKAKIKAIWFIAKPVIVFTIGLVKIFNKKFSNTLNDFISAMDAVYG